MSEMATLDQISEAIGSLRSAQEGTSANIVRLEQRIEGAISGLRASFEANLQEIRNRHHDHNNAVMAMIGNVDRDRERMKDSLDVERNRMRDFLETKITAVEARTIALENFKAGAEKKEQDHLRWSGFIAALIASIATGTIEGLIYLLGVHH